MVTYQPTMCRAARREVIGLGAVVRGRAQRPPLRIERADSGLLLRVVAGNLPLAYLRIDDWWEEVVWLATPNKALVIPPIEAARTMTSLPDSPAWWFAWMTKILCALDESMMSPLFDGAWLCAPIAYGAAAEAKPYPKIPSDGLSSPPPLAHSAERTLSGAMLTYDDWCAGWGERVNMGRLWPLRLPSKADDGRIKAWRKSARAGTLPPAVLLYVSVIGAYLVLDGHDRIHAAVLENLPPPLIAIWPAREPALAPPRPITRAWSMAGGVATWRREVAALLATSHNPDPDSVSFLLQT